MKQQHTLQPKLRFSEFNQKAVIKRAGDIFINYSNKNHDGKLEVLAITQDRGAVPRSLINYDVQVTEEGVSNYKIVEKGNFIISLRSFQGGIEYSDYDGICSPAYIILKSKEEIIDNYFKYYLKTYNYINQLKRTLEGIRDGKMIPYRYFSDTILTIPSLPEQQKIADYLSTIDTKINLLEEKKAQLALYKKAIMQKLFTQEIRFKDEKGNDFPKWEEKRLGDISKITTGKLDANAMIPNGEYRFYTCAKEYYKIDKYAFDCEALLISGNGANVGYIHHYKGKFNAYQRTYVLTDLAQNFEFIKYQLDQFLHIRISREKKEGNTPYIVLSTLTEMLLKIPIKQEQQKIADFLSVLDESIKKVNEQITQTQSFKKAMLQQMFV